MLQVVVLIAAFFLGVWTFLLLVLRLLSKKHSWILPVFAIGLGAPRWCQMLWGTTFVGFGVPWAEYGTGLNRVRTGLLLGKSLWLWLGVLDAVQGVGFGMMLLQGFPFNNRSGLWVIDFDTNAYRLYTYYRSSPRIGCHYLRQGLRSG